MNDFFSLFLAFVEICFREVRRWKRAMIEAKRKRE